LFFFFFQAEDGIRDKLVTGVQTCALPILSRYLSSAWKSRTGCSMLKASRDNKASLGKKATGTPQEEEIHEATRLYQGHRNRRGRRCNLGSTGDRAIHAGNQMANDNKLAEIARHAARRCRADGQGGRRGHRQQVPDPDLLRGRNRSRPASS